MRESLRGYAQGILYLAGQSGSHDRVVEDLKAFDTLLGSQELLADVMCDPSVPAVKRQAILGDLLASKVDPLATRLLQAIVGTGTPRSITDDVSELARMVGGEEGMTLDGGLATLGRITGYSRALLESTAGSGDIELIEGELFSFSRIVESNVRLRRLLSGIGTVSEQRKMLVGSLLSGKSHEITLRIAEFAASTDRLRDFVEVLDAIVANAADLRQRKVAVVKSATALTQDQLGQISAALSRAVGSDIEMRASIDPSLIGGVLAVVGDTVFDGSVRTRIEQLRVRLGLPATVKSRERN